MANSRGIRLAKLREAADMTLEEVGKAIDKSRQTVHRYEADDAARIRPKVLEKIAAAYKTTPEYIETGKHPAPIMQVAPEEHPLGPLMSDKSNARFAAHFDKKEMVYYRRLEIGARATFAESFMNDYDYRDLPLFPVIRMIGDPEEGLVVDIDGDSMEPQLRSGMKVLVEELSNVDQWKDARPGVYIVVFQHHFVIKRIKHNTLRATGKVILESDNAEGGIEEVIIDDIHGMWRVIRGVDVPIR
ncbi:helix-turn-helix domain-containing protein [Hymenobacter lapidiphilus]|uniref:LexA family transcriptional regulator n=1 Tax=Hymenobacter sp. CCM 8763 TaxID=2303334 RepID=UPI000E3473C7|nr:LexA family transcriptional regulator [Hymenobacter sp. CCM 8763]RFP65900.1 helix-turn-helix domain-containing protein [Hymenobacter sp. CCM 8763]